jgi:septal ring factor EnvC (AmiA/AmiB activator)
VVARGDHIAESSDKGSSGSYHLYFEVRKDGVDDEHVIDPYGWELWEE